MGEMISDKGVLFILGHSIGVFYVQFNVFKLMVGPQKIQQFQLGAAWPEEKHILEVADSIAQFLVILGLLLLLLVVHAILTFARAEFFFPMGGLIGDNLCSDGVGGEFH
jgi:hypothetical protein